MVVPEGPGGGVRCAEQELGWLVNGGVGGLVVGGLLRRGRGMRRSMC